MTTLDQFDGDDTEHYTETVEVVVGWNPDALTWVANARRPNGESAVAEGAKPEIALSNLAEMVETFDFN